MSIRRMVVLSGAHGIAPLAQPTAQQRSGNGRRTGHFATGSRSRCRPAAVTMCATGSVDGEVAALDGAQLHVARLGKGNHDLVR